MTNPIYFGRVFLLIGLPVIFLSLVSNSFPIPTSQVIKKVPCDKMVKPDGLPDSIWNTLKPKLCAGNGTVSLETAPEVCDQLGGNLKHHPACQKWKREKANNDTAPQFDNWNVLNCLLQHLEKSPKEQKKAEQTCRFKSGTGADPKRANQANAYLRELIASLSVIDQCNAQVNKQQGQDEEDDLLLPNHMCHFLDQEHMLEHCFHFHLFDQYQHCEGISWNKNGTISPVVKSPLLTLPSDPATMFRFVVWHRTVTEQQYQIDQVVAKTNPRLAIVMHCLHDPTWRQDAGHRCHRVVQKLKNVHYTKEEIILQKMFAQKQKDETRYDCFTSYHQEQKLAKCKWISWQP